MNKHLTLNGFLQQIEEGKLRKIEAYNYIGTITDNFRTDKLKLTLEDIDDAIAERRSHHQEQWHELLPQLKPKYNEFGERVSRLRWYNGKMFDFHKELDSVIDVQIHHLQTLKDIVVSKLEEYRIEQSAHIAHTIDPVREIGIEQYLNDEGHKHFNKIKQLYQKVESKKDYVSMLFALGELGLLSINPLSIGQSSYHRALVATFGKASVGGRANLSHFFTRLSDPFEKAQIQCQKLLIQKVIS